MGSAKKRKGVRSECSDVCRGFGVDIRVLQQTPEPLGNSRFLEMPHCLSSICLTKSRYTAKLQVRERLWKWWSQRRVFKAVASSRFQNHMWFAALWGTSLGLWKSFFPLCCQNRARPIKGINSCAGVRVLFTPNLLLELFTVMSLSSLKKPSLRYISRLIVERLFLVLIQPFHSLSLTRVKTMNKNKTAKVFRCIPNTFCWLQHARGQAVCIAVQQPSVNRSTRAGSGVISLPLHLPLNPDPWNVPVTPSSGAEAQL